MAVIWEKQSELNSAVERSRHLAQQLQDLRDKLKLDGSKSELVSALDKNEKLNQQVLESEKEIEKLKAEIGQLKEKLSLLGTQYNECSGQLTACRQDPLVETMRSKVDLVWSPDPSIVSRVITCCVLPLSRIRSAQLHPQKLNSLSDDHN